MLSKGKVIYEGISGNVTLYYIPHLSARLSASRISYPTPGETSAGTHWGVSRVSVGYLEKRKVSCPCRESNYDSSIDHPVL
jgi:hypothetical protein